MKTRIIPVVWGVGKGPEPKSAFHTSLSAMGSPHQNFLHYSSVIPIHSRVQIMPEGNFDMIGTAWGYERKAVWAENFTHTPRKSVYAGLGWSYRVHPDGGGLLIECTGNSEDMVKDLITAGLETMITLEKKRHNIEFHPEIHSKIIGAKNGPEGGYLSVMVCALFELRKTFKHLPDVDEDHLYVEEKDTKLFLFHSVNEHKKMLLVKTVVKQSPLGGLGLFADEDIKKGTITWTYHPSFDISFSKEDVEKMTTMQKELILTYAYLSMKSNKYIYSIDNSRFTNHSSKQFNVAEVKSNHPEGADAAIRDIKKGEEILCNYREFDAADANSNEEYLDN